MTGIVHILLVQARFQFCNCLVINNVTQILTYYNQFNNRGVMAMDGGTSSDPYCKITLGKEKAKTKILNNTLNPKWREAFDLNW